jgi:hypothetical protein
VPNRKVNGQLSLDFAQNFPDTIVQANDVRRHIESALRDLERSAWLHFDGQYSYPTRLITIGSRTRERSTGQYNSSRFRAARWRGAHRA